MNQKSFPQKHEDLMTVQRDLRHTFNYTPDMELYETAEFWTVMKNGDNRGDCEDFALTCRQRLIDMGWDRADLRPACCWTETGGYHAVLVAEIEGDAYVLDNRQYRVRPWEHLPYKWHKILDKSGEFWVEIEAGCAGE